jgi:hypothetical protein
VYSIIASHESQTLKIRMTTLEEFSRQIEALLPYAAPVLVYPRTYSGFGSWITGGTALLVRTETNRFLITADHFVTRIDELRESSDIVVLLARTNAPLIDITQWTTLGRDNFTDICTIQIPRDFEAGEINKYLFELDLTQSTRATVGDQALILGFPAAHREAIGNRINTRVLPIMDYVTDVGVRRFTIADENSQRKILINPHNLTFPEHLGGMSGSPVFRITESASPALMGIFCQGSDGLRGAYFCSHLNFLLPDGSLDSNALPPR